MKQRGCMNVVESACQHRSIPYISSDWRFKPMDCVRCVIVETWTSKSTAFVSVTGVVVRLARTLPMQPGLKNQDAIALNHLFMP